MLIPCPPPLPLYPHHLEENEGVLAECGEDEADAAGHPVLHRGLLTRHRDLLAACRREREWIESVVNNSFSLLNYGDNSHFHG